MIADLSGLLDQIEYEDIVTWVEKMKPLKGLIDELYNEPESILQYCNQLEMVSSSYIEPCIEENGVNIKQLRLIGYKLDRFSELVQYFPNLERLYIYNYYGYPDGYYDGPIFRRLEIFEFLSSCADIQYNFQFIDSCPNLQSAHIYLQPNRIFVDESVKHESLQDLVIEFKRAKRQVAKPYAPKPTPSLVKYDQIDYEVEADHITEIDGEPYIAVKSAWYSKSSEYNMGDDNIELPIKPRDPEIFTIKELAKKTLERKKQNKGAKVFACPYCFIEFTPGRSDHCLRHINGDKDRPATCAKRKEKEPDLEKPASLKPIHVRTA
ncbi:uncharacterized protein LOC112539489 [Tetranychus urticae]|uniref:uncharacterized protein LOC112539489 n=1 Tax=Tetranychus urticae TaxID=32264 RepID=UPI000D65C525|nr:uncharacterized protein LOC112539489 [Tetranychus urticae]